jgi:hypothetical protein
MEGTIIKELAEKKNLQSYINETQAKYAPIYWPSLLTVKPVDSLEWKTVIGDRKSGVAGNVTAFNVSAPEHTRDVLREESGKIPSIRGKRTMDEDLLMKYITLTKQIDPDMQRLLDLVYDDVSFCSVAPHKRIDWMLAIIISSGGILSFTNENNVGITTQYDVNFGMPAEHKTGTVGEIWSNSAGATPLKDLKTNIFMPLADLGVTGGVLRMHPSKIYQLLESNEVLNKFGMLSKGTTDNLDLNLTKVNAYLAANEFPTIRPFNASIGIENDGKVRYSNPFAVDNVVFTPDGPIGKLHVAPIVEKERPQKQVTYAEYSGALIKKFSSVDPVVETTAYEFNAFPSWDTIDQSFILNTNRKGSFSA